MSRYLIVNADDFGQSPGINAGVLRSHRLGIVTSASLMVRWPAAAEAARMALDHPQLSVGLHVDLGQWSYRDGSWVADYGVVDPDDGPQVAAEVERQVEAFGELMGRAPTHVDGHQHVQRSEPARSVLLAAAAELGVPLRLHSGVRYSGEFYGQSGKGERYHEAITVDAVLAVLGHLAPGWHELGCHPGLHDDAPACYRAERSVETEVLCDPRLRHGLAGAGVELRSFVDLARFTASVPDTARGSRTR